jgi:hypothetical protein
MQIMGFWWPNFFIFLYLKAVLWIRIYWIRIRIQYVKLIRIRILFCLKDFPFLYLRSFSLFAIRLRVPTQLNLDPILIQFWIRNTCERYLRYDVNLFNLWQGSCGPAQGGDEPFCGRKASPSCQGHLSCRHQPGSGTSVFYALRLLAWDFNTYLLIPTKKHCCGSVNIS